MLSHRTKSHQPPPSFLSEKAQSELQSAQRPFLSSGCVVERGGDDSPGPPLFGFHRSRAILLARGPVAFGQGPFAPALICWRKIHRAEIRRAQKWAQCSRRSRGGLAKYLKGYGGRGRNRTYNLSIKSRMLCQLSYASGMATAGMLLRVLRTAARGLPPGLFISR
jgi:hypothetical protein